MPAWAVDSDIFKRAVGLFIRNYGKKPTSGADWGMVSGIYKKLGGRVRKAKSSSESFDDEINALRAMYAEQLIDEIHTEYCKK
jgi:hypothetical protein